MSQGEAPSASALPMASVAASYTYDASNMTNTTSPPAPPDWEKIKEGQEIEFYIRTAYFILALLFLLCVCCCFFNRACAWATHLEARGPPKTIFYTQTTWKLLGIHSVMKRQSSC